MKKIIMLLVIAIMAFSLPLTAQAQDQASLLSMLEGKVVADASRAGSTYTDGLIIPYSVDQDGFSSGISVYNSDDVIVTFLIASFDADGNVIDSGSFSLLPGTSVVDMIANLMDGGTMAGQGFTAIFADGQFIADRFIFQGTGAGFGELTMESQPY